MKILDIHTDLTAELARKLWKYVDGVLYWKVQPGYIDISKPAGSLLKGIGYWIIVYKGRRYLRSRLVFLLKYGHWPKGEIDHKDGNPLNDRWQNLYDATHFENMRNTRVKKNSQSGIKYICPIRKKEKSGKIYPYWLFVVKVEYGKTLIYKSFPIRHPDSAIFKEAMLAKAVVFKEKWFKDNPHLVKQYRLYKD